MIGAVLVAFLAEELLLDLDAAALDQDQLVALAGLTGGADIDLAGGVDRVLVAGRRQLHSDIVRGDVLVALVAGGKRQTAECDQPHSTQKMKAHRVVLPCPISW
jgi:hypothetical protein